MTRPEIMAKVDKYTIENDHHSVDEPKTKP